MEDPMNEIADVVNLVTAAVNPDVQKAAVVRYYAPDAGFRHPLCSVSPGPGSRDAILGILQWYRVMSPHLKIDVQNATYNASTRELFVEVVQAFHIRLSPLPTAPARLMVHLVLRPSDDDPNLLQIAMHEDFYHPTDVAALIIPPLIPIIKLLHKLGTITSIVNARIAGLLGFWSAKSGNTEGISTIVCQATGHASTSENADSQKFKTD